MSKKFLLIATFSLFSWVGGPSYAASCHGVVAIGYFNGVHVTHYDAEESLKYIKLHEGIKSDSGVKIDYQLFYNQTNGWLTDLAEAYAQRIKELGDNFSGHYEYLFDLIKGDGPSLDKVSKAFPEFAGFARKFAIYASEKALADLAEQARHPPTKLDYAQHRAIINTIVARREKMVFVAHSQGNLFANVAYAYAMKISRTPVHVIHIAPASVKFHGPRVLADKDFVINDLLRLMGGVPSSTAMIPMYLERLPGDNGGRDPSGHGFVEIYLNNRFGESPGIAPYDQIKTYMDEFVNGKGLHGAWSGELVQENPRLVFPIKLNFRGVRGVSAAPTHNCHGRMRLVKQNGDVFVYSNHNIGCRKIVTDTIVTLHRDRQNLSGSWEPIFAFGSHVSGHAVLRKVADECSARGKNESF